MFPPSLLHASKAGASCHPEYDVNPILPQTSCDLTGPSRKDTVPATTCQKDDGPEGNSDHDRQSGVIGITNITVRQFPYRRFGSLTTVHQRRQTFLEPASLLFLLRVDRSASRTYGRGFSPMNTRASQLHQS